MPDRPSVLIPPSGTSGWGPWAPEACEPPAPAGPMNWLGAAALALWACATVLALQYL